MATAMGSWHLFPVGGREEGHWHQTPGLMGIAHSQSQLNVSVRLFFPFEVWKEWGSHCSSSFLDSSLLFVFLLRVHTVIPILESYKQDIWGKRKWTFEKSGELQRAQSRVNILLEVKKARP